jgi:hypothetical protein
MHWKLAAPGIAPRNRPPGPTATILYTSAWVLSQPAPGSALNYCVFPEISIQARNNADELRKPRPWTTPFTLRLVDRRGTPTSANFAPSEVPVPIEPNTTLDLVPSPLWCGSTAPGGPLPELYLQVDDRRARVKFARQAPRPPIDSAR